MSSTDNSSTDLENSKKTTSSLDKSDKSEVNKSKSTESINNIADESGIQTIAATLVVPSGTGAIPKTRIPESKRESKLNKRSDELSFKLRLMIRGQAGRMSNIQVIKMKVVERATELDLIELDDILAQLSEIHQSFQNVNKILLQECPASAIDQDYFTQDAERQEELHFLAARDAIATVRKTVMKSQQISVSQSSSSDNHSDSNLPNLPIPKFSGKYHDWPIYRERFETMVLNETMSSSKKMQYLVMSLEGEAAKLIENFTPVAASLNPAWEILNNRYDNKRLLIKSHLDQLSAIPILKSPAFLPKLLTRVTESVAAIQALGVPELWDCMLVYHVTSRLDITTRQDWENLIGKSKEYPKYQQLEEFLTGRARAVENMPKLEKQPIGKAHGYFTSGDNSASRQSANEKPVTFTKYPCDCCGKEHFIIRCQMFRDYSATVRLCFNCLGKHSAANCKETQRCKVCDGKHHTMLHDTAPGQSQSRTATTSAEKSQAKSTEKD